MELSANFLLMALGIGIPLNVVAGIAIGMLVERVRWNSRIEQGIIPKPGRPWDYLRRGRII